MSSEHWQRLQEIFHDAAERNREARDAFLDAACSGDPELRAEVESLLAAHVELPSYFEKPAERMVPRFGLDAPAGAWAGKLIGAYRLQKEIGRGGMGVVYLASRDDGQFHKQAAIKLVPSLGSEEVRQRFLHERQTLAVLDHAHVARLYDGGLSDEGFPYFVMEYVDGLPIDVYCDAHKLDTVERLQLFREVCAAVQYAHQHLIVHRDLKPSNILVTKEGIPKLLDFGIAKLLAQDGASTTELTTPGDRLMTPDYASPEQARGETITTASDVYSLGVILYKLLTGHRPYQFPSAAHAEIERVICETQPEKPSTVIGKTETLGAATVTPEAISATREGSPEKLRRRLAGDLDNIVLKALHKDPQRRYVSVEQFSEDIRRHLAGLPVIARPDTLAYRANKFVRRHKYAVAAAFIFLGVVLGFSIYTQVQAQRIAQERDKAEQVADFLTEIFEIADPSIANGDTITAREILDRGAQRIRQELGQQPLVQAMMMKTIAKVYQKLGLYERALSLFESALAFRRSEHAGNHLEVAESVSDLAELLRNRGDYAAAEPFYREALTMRRELLGDEHELVAESLNNLALLVHHQGNLAAADSLYRLALTRQRRLLGEENVAVAMTLNNLASLLQNQGKFDEAEPLFREALALRRKLLGNVHHDVAVSLSNLGLLLDDKGDYNGAELLYREALAIYRKLFGNEHPSIAILLSNLAVLSFNRGNYDASDSLFREAIALQRKLLGDEHPDLTTNVNNLANVLFIKGEYDVADSLFRRVIASDRKKLGDKHPDLAKSLNNLARVLHAKGELEEAESLHREALAMRREFLGEPHPSIAVSLNNLAMVLKDRGNFSSAEPLLREALAMRRELLGEEHPEVAASLNNLAELLRARGDLAAADSFCQQALALRRKILPAEHPDLAVSLATQGAILIGKGEYGSAEPLLREALSIQRQALPENHLQTVETENLLGACLVELQRFEEAETLLVESCSVIAAKDNALRQRTRTAHQRLALLYEAWNKSEKAAQYRALLSNDDKAELATK